MINSLSKCRKSNGFVNPQPPSRTIEPIENLQGVMRVRPQKPTTSANCVSAASQPSFISNNKMHKNGLVNTKVQETPITSSPVLTNLSSFLPLLPKSPLSSVELLSPASSQIHKATTGSTPITKDIANSLTITPTVILSTRSNPPNLVSKRKHKVRSMDSNSEVSKLDIKTCFIH